MMQSLEAGRRYDIDWLRAGALCLLIVFHVLSVFALERWEVNYPQQGIWADHLMAILSPWRMSLVFLVGGVALRYLMEKVGPAGLIRDRVMRLVPPFLLAVLVLVPPAEYLGQLEHGRFSGNFLQFLDNEVWIELDQHGLWMPPQQHAWFLPYLLAYCAIAASIAQRAPGALAAGQRFIETRFQGWRLVAGLALLFMTVDGLVQALHPRSNVFISDIAGHSLYAPVFALGFLMARSGPVWTWLAQTWRALALIAGAALVALMMARLNTDVFATGIPSLPLGALSGLYGAIALTAIIAFGRANLNRPSPLLTYANEAILPIYILHMLFLIVAAHFVAGRNWPVWAALPALIVIAAAGPLILYEFCIRRYDPLRFLFGMRRRRGPHHSPLGKEKPLRGTAGPP